MNSYEVDVHNLLVGGLEHLVYFSHHIRNVITPTIFQRGRLNHQPDKHIKTVWVDPDSAIINHHESSLTNS